MPGYSFDSSFSPIDPSTTREFVSSGNRGNSPGSSAFSNILNTLAPVGMTAANVFGGQVVSTAVSSALGGGSGSYGGAFGGGMMRSGFGAGAIPAPPAPPMGGGGLGAPPSPYGLGGGASGAGFGPDAMQGNIDAMFNNNMVFLAMQTKVQNMSQQMQSISNIFKADHDARSNAIRNFRS